MPTAATWLSLLRVGWDMVNAHTARGDLGKDLPLLRRSPRDVQLLLRKHAAAAYDCCANSLANESVLDVFGTIDSLSDLDVIPTRATACDAFIGPVRSSPTESFS